MSKKQLIVAWVMGVSISLAVLSEPHRSEYHLFPYAPEPYQWILVFLIIGGLLIYTLRDKKK